MVKLVIRQTFKFVNVNISQTEVVDSPWVPRINEQITTLGLSGEVKELRNVLVSPKRYVSLTLEDTLSDRTIDAGDVSIMFSNECVAAFAYIEGTAEYDHTRIFNVKNHLHLIEGETMLPETDPLPFDEEQFDRQFGVKTNKRWF